ncbi:MAG: FtsQ-type POTRA domain-containing protein [bacterium]
MDRRVRDRRRSINRQRGHRRATLFIALLGVLVLAALFLWLRSSDVFAVKRVTATAVEHVTPSEISRATADARGVSLLRLSTSAIAERLAELPYVRSVEVYRRFPNTLDIRLVEYEPAARLRAEDGDLWLLAGDGRALEKSAATGLPVVVPDVHVSPLAGKRVPNQIIAALPVAALLRSEDRATSLPPVDRIVVSPTGQVTVVLKDGAELRLGEPVQLKQKLMVASTIIEQYLRDGKQLEYVDARVPDRVAVNAK